MTELPDGVEFSFAGEAEDQKSMVFFLVGVHHRHFSDVCHSGFAVQQLLQAFVVIGAIASSRWAFCSGCSSRVGRSVS
jgi:hypothetical protein